MESFAVFRSYADELRVGLFGKDDDCQSDEECGARLGFERTSKLMQVHGDVIHIAEEIEGIPDGDGLITQEVHHAVSVRWADCQGFAVYAPEKRVLAVLHAGWRGMAAKAITALYEKLSALGVDPGATYVGMSPSLCKDCAEFTNPMTELPEHLHPYAEGRHVDLQAAADDELASLGVPASQRERHPACTKCGEGFFSYRNGEESRNFLVAGMV